jgi:hypothetical protein
VLAIETGNNPLIGTGLLKGFRLTIDVIHDGPVTIEALP